MQPVLASAMDGSKVLSLGEAGLVCLMGVGIVFAGLICIVLICMLMSALIKSSSNNEAAKATAPAAPIGIDDTLPAERRGEFIAAVSAALADELGTDTNGIKITSVKKL